MDNPYFFTTFKCPKCESEFLRDRHYETILEQQNLINAISGYPQIEDMCSKCNYFKAEEK